jgi:hypothetical protein
MRTLTEITYWIVSIEKNEDVHKIYIRQDQLFRKKIFKHAKNDPELKRFLPEGEIEKLLTVTEAIIQELDIKKNDTDIWKIAELAGLSDLYNTSYPHYCQSTHCGPRNLESNYLEGDCNGNIIGLKYGPSFNFPSGIFYFTMIHHGHILYSIKNHFGIEYPSEIQSKINLVDKIINSNSK